MNFIYLLIEFLDELVFGVGILILGPVALLIGLPCHSNYSPISNH